MQPILYDSSAGQPPRSRVVNTHGIWTSTIWQCMYHIHNYVCAYIYCYNHIIIIIIIINIIIIIIIVVVLLLWILSLLCVFVLSLSDWVIPPPPFARERLLWIDPNRQLSARESQNPRRTSACWPETFHWATVMLRLMNPGKFLPQVRMALGFSNSGIDYNILQCIMID